MKIALIGATGYVGSAILREALDRGHEVTAIARHPEKLIPHLKLHPRKADIYNDTPDFPEQWKGTARATADVLQLLRGEQEIQWTCLSPAAMLHLREAPAGFGLERLATAFMNNPG